jgi:predicted adenylyl cyclase CyaB
MARNVEFKARVAEPEALEARVGALAERGPTVIEQDDLFFRAGTGRLKLRRLDRDRGELIHYQRDDARGPRLSEYRVVPTSDPEGLSELLSRALGVRGRVRKRRRLYLCGASRLHLDRVEGLGDFLEIEVVLDEGQTTEEGGRVARELMGTLGIAEEDLVDVAYVDLLEARARE